MQRKNVGTDDVIDFLRRLRKKLRRPLIVVWDRWSVHRSAERRILQKGWKGIEFEYLPAYCPELNPVEALERLSGATPSTPTWRTSSPTMLSG